MRRSDSQNNRGNGKSCSKYSGKRRCGNSGQKQNRYQRQRQIKKKKDTVKKNQTRRQGTRSNHQGRDNENGNDSASVTTENHSDRIYDALGIYRHSSDCQEDTSSPVVALSSTIFGGSDPVGNESFGSPRSQQDINSFTPLSDPIEIEEQEASEQGDRIGFEGVGHEADSAQSSDGGSCPVLESEERSHNSDEILHSPHTPGNLTRSSCGSTSDFPAYSTPDSPLKEAKDQDSNVLPDSGSCSSVTSLPEAYSRETTPSEPGSDYSSHNATSTFSDPHTADKVDSENEAETQERGLDNEGSPAVRSPSVYSLSKDSTSALAEGEPIQYLDREPASPQSPELGSAPRSRAQSFCSAQSRLASNAPHPSKDEEYHVGVHDQDFRSVSSSRPQSVQLRRSYIASGLYESQQPPDIQNSHQEFCEQDCQTAPNALPQSPHSIYSQLSPSLHPEGVDEFEIQRVSDGRVLHSGAGTRSLSLSSTGSSQNSETPRTGPPHSEEDQHTQGQDWTQIPQDKESTYSSHSPRPISPSSSGISTRTPQAAAASPTSESGRALPPPLHPDSPPLSHPNPSKSLCMSPNGEDNNDIAPDNPPPRTPDFPVQDNLRRSSVVSALPSEPEANCIPQTVFPFSGAASVRSPSICSDFGPPDSAEDAIIVRSPEEQVHITSPGEHYGEGAQAELVNNDDSLPGTRKVHDDTEDHLASRHPKQELSYHTRQQGNIEHMGQPLSTPSVETSPSPAAGPAGAPATVVARSPSTASSGVIATQRQNPLPRAGEAVVAEPEDRQSPAERSGPEMNEGAGAGVVDQGTSAGPGPATQTQGTMTSAPDTRDEANTSSAENGMSDVQRPRNALNTRPNYADGGTQTEVSKSRSMARLKRFAKWLWKHKLDILLGLVYNLGLVNFTINTYTLKAWWGVLSNGGRTALMAPCFMFFVDLACIILVMLSVHERSDTLKIWIAFLESALICCYVPLAIFLPIKRFVHKDYEWSWAQSGGKSQLKGRELSAFQSAWNWTLVSTDILGLVCLVLAFGPCLLKICLAIGRSAQRVLGRKVPQEAQRPRNESDSHAANAAQV
ncbi:uncharacterized protein B0I36DRAFT_414076 [Microdochium trichocladiopsis]|uniref:Uncharacterized protein n=1 Tax=Microdochium trichocladiopsis TaxID=1682393 RepID=A0A9P9BQD3_9PEZI|nr:uncharacterized protein B0I36DRAFT_414076 [Microdochium trichocladiopsis]KAH7025752.1 hypothetical protein B0I36DRAFT_414076 [Microdochium trichocladiopsis]